MHLNINTVTGLVDGYRTECASELLHGSVGNIVGQGKAVTVAFYDGAYLWVSLVRQNGIWSHYVNTGGGIVEWNTGTWSNAFGTDAADSGAAITD